MQITQHGQYYQIVNVTSQRHNLLALLCGEGETAGPPVVERFPAIAGVEREFLDPQELLKAVLAGVERANREHGRRFRVRVLRYVENDTPPESIYSELAYRLIVHMIRERSG